MIEALRFAQASPKLIAPPIAEGLPNGLVLQLWIRRTGDTTRQPIVELAGATSQIVLRTGDRPDVLSLALIANGKTTEISAPGALPIARWVQVRATVKPDGSAELDVLGIKLAQAKLAAPGSEARTLKIGGFIGELAQLQFWKHRSPTVLSYDPPTLNAPNLWAYYPLAKLEWDEASKRNVAKDAGPNQRHAAVQDTTSTAAPTRVEHDEPLDRGQAAHLRFLNNDHAPRLSPLTGLSGKLTLEAWVCPVGDSPMPVVQLRGTNAGLALVAGGKDGELALLSIADKQSTVLARVTGVARPNLWSHVAVTLEVVKAQGLGITTNMNASLSLGLFVQGQPRKLESFTLFTNATAKNVAALVKQALVPDVRIGGRAPGSYPPFRGGMAELRIWRGAVRERVESLWLARARGDEAELLACCRLDTDPSEPLVDISPRRGTAHAPSGISLAQEQCPPIAATSGELAFRVRARGKLLRERLPSSSVGGLAGASTKINLQLTNTTTGESLGTLGGDCRVFDATVEVASRSRNAPVDRVLEVRVDQPLTFLQRNGDRTVPTLWAANQTRSIPLPASGQLRLRFAAQQLACPTIRVRVSGTPGGVWTIVRPDEHAQRQLRTVTTQSLKSPPDGRRSPLPAGTSDVDTQALVDALSRLGTQLVREPSASSNPRKLVASAKFVDDVMDVVDDGIDGAEDIYEDAVDVGVSAGEIIVATGQDALASATTVAKSAGKLIVSGAAELEALAAKCAKVSAWVGQQAIATAITSADQLAFVVTQASSDAAGWVEAIGTSIVNGTEVAWRVIVAGVDDALEAITTLIKRIGAKIQEWIDYLAWLFMWDDFLEASDEAHAYIKATMSSVGQQIAKLDALKQQLADGLRETVEDAIGKRSLADVFGIDADATSPVFEQLEYVQEQVQELFESSDLEWSTSASGEATGIGPSAALSAQSSEIERLQPLGDPSDVVVYLTTPLSELLANNEPLANGSPSIFDAVFDPIVESSTELIEQLDSALFSRLEVPYLTTFIEEVILCGRTLTLARIMALMAAIPAVLADKTSGEAETKSQITIQSRDALSQAEFDQNTRWGLWVAMSAGIANTIVIITKSVAERRSQTEKTRKFLSFLQLISGSLGVMRGIISLGRIPAFPARARSYAAINASAELTGGLCAAFFGAQGLKEIRATETRKDWSSVETAIQLILGATVITASGVALAAGDLGTERSKAAFSLRCSSWVLALLVRAFEKLDDNDSSGRLKYLTMGLAAVSVVVDVGEAIYGNVSETETQA